MAGEVKVLQFSEGVSTGSPTQVGVTATNYGSFASDAAYVADKGSAASGGDAYYNTTLNLYRGYAGGAWRSFADESSVQVFSNKSFSTAVNITDTTQSTTKDTGALIVEGGVGIEKNLNVGGNAVITGDLTVNGDFTVINTSVLEVEDANILVNNGGNQATANSNVAGFTVEMSDATHARMGYDSTLTSKFKAGEVGSESELVTTGHTQSLLNKIVNKVTITAPATSATLTLADGKTLTANNTLSFSGTDGSSVALRGGGTVKYIGDYTTTATAAGTTTLTASSTEQQYFTGTTTQNVDMPVTSTLVLGQQYIIRNLSTGLVTVRSSGANTIKVMAPNSQIILTCILTSGTTAASWSFFYSLLNSTSPTIQRFTSGTGTYTTPAGVTWLKVTCIGGGGGGSGSGTASSGNGATGGDTTFGSSLLTAVFGSGGTGGGSGGNGGGGTINSPAISILNFTGGKGNPSLGSTGTGFVPPGASGGNNPAGGAGVGVYNGLGNSGNTNTGGGGGGGSGLANASFSNSGSGGGAGGYIVAIIPNGSVSSSYSYSVGAGGNGGTAGTNGVAGGNGGSGLIVVEEFYN